MEKLKATSHSSEELEAHEQLAIRYTNAKTLKEKGKVQEACQIFQRLAQQVRFALKSLSQLRSLQTCKLVQQEMLEALVEFDLKKNVAYTEEEFLRFALVWLEKHQGPSELIADYSYRLFPYENNLESKIKVIQKAIKLTDSKKYKEQLLEIAPRFIKKPSPDQLILVARDLERAREFSQARSFYQKALNSKELGLEDKLYALERIGLTFKVQRSREKYLSKLEKIGYIIKNFEVSTAQDVKLKADSYIGNQITLARAIWTAHDREKAKSILINMMEDLDQTNADQMAHIYYILGAMELEAKNKQEALNYFKRGLQFPTQDKKIRQYLSWSWAHNLFLMKNYDHAIQAMQTSLEKSEDDPHFQAKLLFWQGMSFLKLNQEALAKQRFKTAIEFSPHSYYSIIAHHKLGRRFDPITKAIEPVRVDRVFDWLVLLDEKNAASAYIENLRERRNLSLKKQVQAYFQAELFHNAIFTYARNSGDLDQHEKDSYIPLIFPTAHLEIYRNMANRHSIPYELALSITRQESAFNKDARSWADAFGLMQLIPEKAEGLSRELELNYNHFPDLYNPELNIQLGTFLLSKLLKRYDQQFPFFIAAYNAGDSPVKNWKRTRYQGNTLEFIEMIPYAETQKYVKLILRNMVIYRQLTTSSAFTLGDIGIFIE